jgi:short-subunit dehydrogenase
MKVKDKVIVVTGGGSGMGRELVLNLLSKDARVITVDINEASLQETKKLAGSKTDSLTTFVVNITDKTAVEAFYQDAVSRYGAVDGLINNAGIIQPFVKLNDLSYDAIERVMKVNFYGTLYMVKSFLPHLLTRPEAHILDISSMGGFLPVPGQTIYGASKAAVKLLTEGLHSELKDTHVNVTVAFPGGVRTNIMANSGLVNRMPSEQDQKGANTTLSAQEAAQIMINAMEKNRYRVLVGKDARFMDFIYRLKPESAANFIYKKMKALLAPGKG